MAPLLSQPASMHWQSCSLVIKTFQGNEVGKYEKYHVCFVKLVFVLTIVIPTQLFISLKCFYYLLSSAVTIICNTTAIQFKGTSCKLQHTLDVSINYLWPHNSMDIIMLSHVEHFCIINLSYNFTLNKHTEPVQ